MLYFLEATATAGAAEAGAPGGFLSSPAMTIVMLVAMVAVFYFMLIRPENKKKKEAEQLRSSLKNGDQITTIGGIVGNVVNIKEDRVVIETSADQVRVELMKWAISTNDSAAAAAKEEAAKAAEAKAKAKAAKKAQKDKKKIDDKA